MKRLILTILCLLTFVGVQAADISSITNAFKSGTASTLTSSMDKEVDVAVPGASKKGNGSEVVSILNNFFQSNKPSDFTVVHHADKKENGFFVGKLPTSTGEYRVNVTYRAEGNKVLIQSIRIE